MQTYANGSFYAILSEKQKLNRMWDNAQRDGRPAEYRWCPLPKESDLNH